MPKPYVVEMKSESSQKPIFGKKKAAAVRVPHEYPVEAPKMGKKKRKGKKGVSVKIKAIKVGK